MGFLDDTIQNAKAETLAGFARNVLKTTLENGFQSLSKRDLELLLFFEMERAGIVDRWASNHDAARQLRITVQKLRNLRRDAYARWASDFERQTLLRATLQRGLAQDRLRRVIGENGDWVAGGHVPILVEHPVARGELENLIKEADAIPRSPRNHEVVLVHFDTLLEILPAVLGKTPSKGELAPVYAALTRDPDLKTLLKTDIKDITWTQFRKATRDGLAKAMVRAAERATAERVIFFTHYFAETIGRLLG